MEGRLVEVDGADKEKVLAELDAGWILARVVDACFKFRVIELQEALPYGVLENG